MVVVVELKVRNKKTGLIWEVEGELAERLSLSPEYEVVEEFNDLEELTVAELRKMAAKKGIEGYSDMKKAELIKALEG